MHEQCITDELLTDLTDKYFIMSAEGGPIVSRQHYRHITHKMANCLFKSRDSRVCPYGGQEKCDGMNRLNLVYLPMGTGMSVGNTPRETISPVNRVKLNTFLVLQRTVRRAGAGDDDLFMNTSLKWIKKNSPIVADVDARVIKSQLWICTRTRMFQD